MTKKSKHFLIFLVITTIIFLFAIALDLSPYLRGPAPYAPDWRWAYLYVNTLPRVFPALLCLGCMLFLFYKTDRKTLSQTSELRLVFGLMMLSFLFQFALLYFSRSGIGVLLHRTLDPAINGYFTVAMATHDIPLYLKTFVQHALSQPGHAQGHPPGTILLLSWLIDFVSPFTPVTKYVATLSPTAPDIMAQWAPLTPTEKTVALISPFLIQFLTSLTVVPLYFATKRLYGIPTAGRTAFLYALLPNVVFFLPLSDSVFPLFGATALFFLLKGIEEREGFSLFLSGFSLAAGLFFSLSLLPVALILGLYVLVSFRQSRRAIFPALWQFLAGIVLPYFFLWLFFTYNVLTVSWTLMLGLPEDRAYTTWVFYNLYDFFVFSGIAVSLAALATVPEAIRGVQKKSRRKLPLLLILFWLILFLLALSGSVRGEVGRIWLPFAPFMALCAAFYVTERQKFPTRYMLILLLLQAVQILVMQEFWVMLW